MTPVVKYLRYALELQAPAIVTTLSGDPNSAATQQFIPGSAVRGALAAELLSKGISADHDDFRRLILEDRVRFLHAYPAGETGTARSLPVPIPWRKEKGKDGQQVYDLAAYSGEIGVESITAGGEGELEFDSDDPWPPKPLQHPQVPFARFDGSTCRSVHVRIDSRVHQQRDRVRGRSGRAEEVASGDELAGTPFAYEFLERAQMFHGVIQFLADSEKEAELLIEAVKVQLDQRQIFIGRSRRAGYGGAATVTFQTVESQEVAWGAIQRDDLPADSLFRVYLLSACVARDPCTGQVDPAALPQLLVAMLGGNENVAVDRIFWEFEIIGGFNRKWRLEVPQVLAVKAGSVLVLRAKQTIHGERLRASVHWGIGERRAEGFGRFTFLQHDATAPTIQVESAAAKKPEVHPQPSGDPPELVLFLQQRLVDAAFSQALDRKVRDIVGDLKNTKLPTASLLGRLRIPLRNGGPEDALKTLRQWLENPDSNKRTALREEAQKKLRECRLSGGVTLRDWLIDAANVAFGKKCADSAQREYPLGADDRLARQVTERMGAQYAVRLIDAVLAALARHVRRRGETVS